MPKKARGRATDVLLFDPARLSQAAGSEVYQRGEDYHLNGRVEILVVEPGRVVANVLGTQDYRSELNLSDDGLSGDCSCPYFADWGFCKHMVAAGLAANALPADEIRQAANRTGSIRAHLRAQGIDTLVEIVMGLAGADPALRRRLELAAAADETDDRQLFAHFDRAITEATSTRGFIEYGETRAWAERIEEVLDQIETLLERGHADVVLRLLDKFFPLIEEALCNIDDSNGHGGGIVAQAVELHIEACHATKPEPIALARTLFAREMESDWEFFHGASEAYRDVLGDAGLAEYRRLAEDAWRKIPPADPAYPSSHGAGFRDRYQLASILDRFAEQDGDIDARIAIRTKSLTSAYAYLRIAELCLDHGRDAEALQWAEQGLPAFADRPDDRLTAFAADLYCRLGRVDDAETLLWRAFERRPSLDWYNRLKKLTDDGAAPTRSVADRAVAVLRAELEPADGKRSERWPPRADLLVEILMTEGRLKEAWTAVRAHRCQDEVLQSLAGASEKTLPAEAIAAYGELVERHVQQTNNYGYQAACELIERIRGVRNNLGQQAAHAAYLDDLRVRYKAKRNFMKLLSPNAGE